MMLVNVRDLAPLLSATLQSPETLHSQTDVFVLPVAALIVFVPRAVFCSKCFTARGKSSVNIPKEAFFTGDLQADWDVFVSAQLHTGQRVCRLLRPAAPVPPGQRSVAAGETKAPLASVPGLTRCSLPQRQLSSSAAIDSWSSST